MVIELRKVGVDVVTFGQYMRPTKRHMKVARYVQPSEFLELKGIAESLGFLYVASGPLVRSSYKVSINEHIIHLLTVHEAGEFYIENVLRSRKAEQTILGPELPTSSITSHSLGL